MLSLQLFSQDTKITDSITISVNALKSMYKESLKHENLKTAYQLQYNTLQELADSNLQYFAEMQAAEITRELLQKDLNKALIALRKKKNKWMLPTAVGLVGGLVGGFVLSR